MIKTVWILVFGGMCSSLFAQALSPKVSRGTDATSCETDTLNLDLIADKLANGQLKDEFVILISRPGKNERFSNLHTRRLHTITSYLERRTNRQLQMITAVGSRTGELGRVEMYVQGKLFAVFSAPRCEDIPVGICDDKDADPKYYLSGSFRRKCN